MTQGMSLAAAALSRLSFRDVRTLPYDVLVKILARLDPSAVKTARLVCRAFRAASLPSITYLGNNLTDLDSTKQLTLAHDLRVFTSVTCLDLRVSLPQCTSALALPGVCSTLCRLHLVEGKEELTPADSLAALAPLLATATRLTAFWVDSFLLDQPTAAVPLAYALGACRAMQMLTLDICRTHDADIPYAALQISSLATLHVNISDMSPLSKVSSLTRLQSLGSLSLSCDNDVDLVVALTQLTHLTLHAAEWSFPESITRLSKLSGLQVLSLDDADVYITMAQLAAIVRPMMQLQELSCWLLDPDVAALDPLLASLTALTSLNLGDRDLDFRGWPSPLPRFPGSFLPNGLAGLCSLTMVVQLDDYADACNLATVLTGLQSLKVSFVSGVCRDLFLCHMAPMPHLRELSVRTYTVEQVRPWSSARFLTALPRLRNLYLEEVLDEKRWDEDVRYIVALTELTKM
eukprot:jgi/Botrbrau1/10270/Bobra.0140s0023.1